MLVVVGSRHDQNAQDLVAKWAPYDAALLTCEDLSAAGWDWQLSDRFGSRVVVSGRVIGEDEIRGVVVRRPWILDKELTHISAPDREYVAAEMNAFMLAWLSILPCRVLNRPSGASLCGPNWHPLQWLHAAVSAGISIPTTRWQVPLNRKRKHGGRDTSRSPIEVTVVGGRCLGAPNDTYAAAARRLAVRANTGLLAVRFERGECGPSFVSAGAIPSLRDPEISQAVAEYLLSGGPSS